MFLLASAIDAPMQTSAPGVLLHKLNYRMKHDFPAVPCSNCGLYTTEAGSFKHFKSSSLAGCLEKVNPQTLF